ncbi:L,D-transpeptidase catalytic domain [Altererythrobacter xiamenensis]|uniref:L,D-transpeptidase catalytic domain n=1 Tax=Altererythrobacter xiamenensis TaxID=1316679 RepID=A0A1Y6EK89_9SPHN|nr:L,D-transpeptidase family protein [Altererythrobacter xiamenensis]SMQ61340.1 L,D-transpeptidase catalytic domain [Altererythrobacter xiamenensis]
MRIEVLLPMLVLFGCAADQQGAETVSGDAGLAPAESAYASADYQRRGASREIRRPGGPAFADFVLVDKSDRILVAYSDGKAIRAYRGIQFGDAPLGHKRFEGDERTPEGRYTIDRRNPQSSYYLSLGISYPNRSDRAFAASYGRSPGGDIFIHGQPNGLASDLRMRGDWTDGCIALANHEIEELWRLVPNGTPIVIRQ